MAIEPRRTDTDPVVRETLTCEVVPDRDVVRVRPVGTLDIASAPVLDEQLEELRQSGFRSLIIDLGGLEFMDSTGLRLLLRRDAASRSDGFRLGLIAGSPTIQRVFELTGTTTELQFVDPARP